jgi:hypothetical protein
MTYALIILSVWHGQLNLSINEYKDEFKCTDAGLLALKSDVAIVDIECNETGNY